ncbi:MULTISPECIES: hypothetical protein [unclassified Mycolicibacterium]|uniref:hypothetical protein n=1 Tax=unclassified Mycolicibacterium TaxID=2636767 RepID=UPI0028165443|nr:MULTISPECIES: hypothetical protein [unclassified Mycolicibacterium]
MIAVLVPSFTVAMPGAAADPNVAFFLSPSRNISCEIDYQRPGIPDGAFCFSVVPPQSAHLTPDGSVSVCNGDSCLANPPVDTPSLAYGNAATRGPITCRSDEPGITCTVPSGRGFVISRSGIERVG